LSIALHIDDALSFEERCAAEWPRLVGLCSRITGHRESAEDLAQETLTEAWRLRDRLTDPAGMDRWLSAIARNVCRRWMRSQGREGGRLAAVDDAHAEPADAWDLEVELERAELAALLDRALALLPADTRAGLIARYIEDLPLEEIAARLGSSLGAVAMRLQRGRLAMRRLLESELRAEAAAYGLAGDTGAWQETRIWCPFCGMARLHGSFVPGDHLHLRCPHCCRVHPPGFNVACVSGSNTSRDDLQRLLGGIKTFRPALNRILGVTLDHYRAALAAGTLLCRRCGTPNPVRFEPPEGLDHPATLRDEPQVHARCANCGAIAHEALKHLALQLPEVRAFWRAHPRTRLLPYQMVEHAGTDVWLTTFESLSGSEAVTVAARATTLEPIPLP